MRTRLLSSLAMIPRLRLLCLLSSLLSLSLSVCCSPLSLLLLLCVVHGSCSCLCAVSCAAPCLLPCFPVLLAALHRLHVRTALPAKGSVQALLHSVRRVTKGSESQLSTPTHRPTVGAPSNCLRIRGVSAGHVMVRVSCLVSYRVVSYLVSHVSRLLFLQHGRLKVRTDAEKAAAEQRKNEEKATKFRDASAVLLKMVHLSCRLPRFHVTLTVHVCSAEMSRGTARRCS